jgi:hypothetical protein
MKKSIYLIELVMYLTLGVILSLVISLSSGEPVEAGGILSIVGTFIAILLLLYVYYLIMVSSFGKWTSGMFSKILIMICSAFILIPCELIRRLAFIFYAGDKPVGVVFGEPLVKEIAR